MPVHRKVIGPPLIRVDWRLRDAKVGLVVPACPVEVSLAALDLAVSPDLVASEPVLVFGSTLLPVVTSTPLSVDVLPFEASVGSALGVESFVVLEDSAPLVEAPGVLADSAEESFVVSAAASAAPSGFCADVSVALASAADPTEGVVLAGVLAAVLPIDRVGRVPEAGREVTGAADDRLSTALDQR